MTEDELSERLVRIENKIDRGFNGPEGQPERGVHVRLDRLEQVAKTAVWVVTLVVSSIVAVAVKAFSSGSNPPGNQP